MGRPRKNQAHSVAEIEAEIAEEQEQYAILQRDLRDVLLAGENTRSYRGALAETSEKIEQLHVRLATLKEAEGARRHALTAATAEEIAAESARRHIALLASLDAPAFPNIQGFPHVAL